MTRRYRGNKHKINIIGGFLLYEQSQFLEKPDLRDTKGKVIFFVVVDKARFIINYLMVYGF